MEELVGIILAVKSTQVIIRTLLDGKERRLSLSPTLRLSAKLQGKVGKRGRFSLEGRYVEDFEDIEDY